MKFTKSISIIIVLLALGGCGESKGEKIAIGVCDCYIAAEDDVMKLQQCVQKQIADQEQLSNDPKETFVYTQKLSTCKALAR